MKKIEEMEALIATMKEDMQKTINGNNSSATRVRKACQAIKKLCGELRQEVQDLRAAKKD